jgi:hypothetical protein
MNQGPPAISGYQRSSASGPLSRLGPGFPDRGGVVILAGMSRRSRNKYSPEVFA